MRLLQCTLGNCASGARWSHLSSSNLTATGYKRDRAARPALRQYNHWNGVSDMHDSLVCL